MSKTTKAPGNDVGARWKPPSDLELMLYADGELDAERAAAVEAYLAELASSAQRAPQAKLAALGVVSGIVREGALEAASPADGIADAVMAQIAAEGAASPAQPAKAAVELRPTARRAPSNDNARGIFALAAIAVAAAAGMMLWGRAEPKPQARTPEKSYVVEATASAPLQVKTAEAPKPEGDGEHGVEVAAVDFGARLGTIFYVAADAAPASQQTTTVVWLSDDALGGD